MSDFEPFSFRDKASGRQINVPAPGVREYRKDGVITARIYSSGHAFQDKMIDITVSIIALALLVLIPAAGVAGIHAIYQRLSHHHAFHKVATHVTRPIYAEPLQPVPSLAKPAALRPHPPV